MAIYLQIVSDNQNVLIDDTNSRLTLRRVLALSESFYYRANDAAEDADGYFINCKVSQYRIPVASGEKVCFVRNSSNSQYITNWTMGGYHIINVFYKSNVSINLSAVKVYTFGDDPIVTDPHNGLLIYNAQGRIIFSSEQQILYKMAIYNNYYQYSSGMPAESFETGISGQYAINYPGAGAFFPSTYNSWSFPEIEDALRDYYSYPGDVTQRVYGYLGEHVDTPCFVCYVADQNNGTIKLRRVITGMEWWLKWYDLQSSVDYDFCMQTQGMTVSAIDISRFPNSL